MNAKNKSILSVKDLDISFQTSQGKLQAVRGLSFALERGETLAIVGESGSGKSVTCRAIVQILARNGKINSGEIFFSPESCGGKSEIDLLKLTKKEMRNEINGKRIAIVFQDPMSSLNPTMSIGSQLTEGMRHHLGFSKKEAFLRAVSLLEQVGIEDAEKRMKAYPHQFSGGMQQRVVLAIALSCNPDILICDEPTTALDVTIQAKILDLIEQLQAKKKLSVIYITHDLSVVAKVANSVIVMYAGRIVEKGTANDIFFDPRHPYTWGLLSSIPHAQSREDSLYTIPGSPPELINMRPGDAFAARNPYALHIDYRLQPPFFRISETHSVASWLLAPAAPTVALPTKLQRRIAQMKKEADCCDLSGELTPPRAFFGEATVGSQERVSALQDEPQTDDTGGRKYFS